MSELIDLVDEYGTITHVGVDRTAYNKKRQNYPESFMSIVMVAVMTPANEILVHERAPHKSAPNLIDIVCETIKSEEKPNEAVLRGIEEETGLPLSAITEVRPVRAGKNHYDRYRHLYIVTVPAGLTPRPNDEMVWTEFRPFPDVVEYPPETVVTGLHDDLALVAHALNSRSPNGASII